MSASATTRKNVVVIITDDQDTASLPVMRKLMAFPGGSWVNFTNGFVNDSICCPARATMLTGQYAHHHGVIGNGYGDLLDDTNTLPVWLDQAGYQTGMFGKYLNEFPWDRGAGYVPPGWDAFKPGGGQVSDQTEDAVEFIQGSTAPYYLYVAYKAPHTPATPEAQYADADVYVAPDSPNLNEADVSDNLVGCKSSRCSPSPSSTPSKPNVWRPNGSCCRSTTACSRWSTQSPLGGSSTTRSSSSRATTGTRGGPTGTASSGVPTRSAVAFPS